MCRKLINLIFLGLVLALIPVGAANAFDRDDPALVGYWSFNEGSGTVATDLSENSYDGTLYGGTAWTDGIYQGALQFNGSDAYMDTGQSFLNGLAGFTLAGWVSASNVDVYSSLFGQNDLIEFGFIGGSQVGTWLLGNNWQLVSADYTFEYPSWHHLALVGDATGVVIYIDGQEAASDEGGVSSGSSGFTFKVGAGVFNTTGDPFLGEIDDVWVFERALTQEEIQILMLGSGGYPYAFGPVPADGVMLEDTWANISWRAGDFAISHDVYFGDNFDEVNDGTSDTFQGNQPGTFFMVGFPGFAYPDGLVPGTTYYWRIDEVNDLDPNSPWEGDVWSFWIPPKKAYDPNPADGAKFEDTDVEFNWTAGFRAKLHYVYFGDNFDDVNNATVGIPMGITRYTPGTLDLEKTYYWRIDEFDGLATNKGDVWSFRTLPEIPITNPNLMGWWKLDEGSGSNAVDWSGHGNHGTLQGDPQWVAGQVGGALEFDGSGDYVDCGNSPALTITDQITVACWIKVAAFSKTWETILAKGDNSYRMSRGPGDGDSIHFGCNGPTGGDLYATTIVTDDTWHHVALVYDGSNRIIYIDGIEDARVASTGPIDVSSYSLYIGENSQATGRHLTGLVDNVRIYNKALTPAEIQLAMRGDPLLAWGPNPANGSTPYIRDATPLNWSRGDNASQHDVYFGIDKDAVADADASDTTGIYRGRQGVTIYTPPEGVEWGGGPYYWRVDEYNTDATISKGNVWKFTVADFIGIDDIEDYNDYPPDEIFSTWIDGWEVPTNGSLAGHADPPFAETTIVHGGGQSMPVYYENNFKYSEVTMTPTQRDWTEEGVGVLSLWFYGDASNAAERMYVNLNGIATVYHDNSDAALIDDWTEWTIDLQEFAVQSVNLANVNTISIGFGDKNNLQASGSGMVFFDDIRLYRLAESEPEPQP